MLEVEVRSGNSTDDEARLLKGVFTLLVKGHAELAMRAVPERPSLASRLQGLVVEFTRISNRVADIQAANATYDSQIFSRLISDHRTALESYRQAQESVADDFNLLDVMNLTGKEIRHSMVLAWLLDRDLSKLGSHAQGPLGFHLFLTELGLPIEYAKERYWVRREVVGENSIVDIEIGARNRFLIHIENKIWATEGKDQTRREWQDLKRRAVAIGLDAESTDASVHALFLTPTGTCPDCTHFRPISWGRIARVLEEFARLAKPGDVRLFASHYARALRQFIVKESVESEVSLGQSTDE